MPTILGVYQVLKMFDDIFSHFDLRTVQECRSVVLRSKNINISASESSRLKLTYRINICYII